MPHTRAKKIFSSALLGAFIISAETAVAQTGDADGPDPTAPAAEFGNLEDSGGAAEPIPTFVDEEPTTRKRRTIQNGYIGGGEKAPATVPPDVIVAAIESGDRSALFNLMGSDCPSTCGPRLDSSDALHAAAVLGDTTLIDFLVIKGGNVNDRAASSGWTPLMTALYTLNTDMARHLLSAGADPGIIGNDGTSAPFLASLAGLGDLIPYPKLEIEPDEADKLLLRAIEAGSMPYVELALASGARASATAENGWSALMIASFHGEVGAVERLIAADRSIVNYAEPKSGLTAAHAALVGSVDPRDRESLEQILRKLGATGADMSRQTKAGISVLEVAKNQKHGSTVEDLLVGIIAGKEASGAPNTVEDAMLRSSSEPQYLMQNAILLDGPGTKSLVLELMLMGDRIEIVDRDQNGWVRVMAITGTFGYTLEEFLGSTPVSSVQYGAACVDYFPPYESFVIVNGEASSAAAEERLLSEASEKIEAGGAETCSTIEVFSGDECFAIAHSDEVLTASRFLAVAVGKDRGQAGAWAGMWCQEKNEGEWCRGTTIVCAKPARK